MDHQDQTVAGTLELTESGTGYLRDPARNYAVGPNDAQVPRDAAKRFNLRGGETL